jgi:hypothetical protein
MLAKQNMNHYKIGKQAEEKREIHRQSIVLLVAGFVVTLFASLNLCKV